MYHFIICDYYATGEGTTKCFLVTRANPHTDDYATKSRFEDGKFIPGELKNTAKERAMRDFAEQFGDYMALGAEYVSRDEFLSDKYKSYIPDFVRNIINAEPNRQPGNFVWHSEIHANFS